MVFKNGLVQTCLAAYAANISQARILDSNVSFKLTAAATADIVMTYAADKATADLFYKDEDMSAGAIDFGATPATTFDIKLDATSLTMPTATNNTNPTIGFTSTKGKGTTTNCVSVSGSDSIISLGV